MKKSNLIYIALGIITSAVIFFFATRTFARTIEVNNDYWTEWEDTTRCTVTECGTTDGLKGQSRDLIREDKEYSCPVIEFKDHGKTYNIPYEKSEDPTKCHRPSSSTLKNEYGLGKKAVKTFNKNNKEWLDASVEVTKTVLDTQSRRVPCQGEKFDCKTERWCVPSEDGFVAKAIPTNEDKPKGSKRWEQGMDANCEFDVPEEPEEPEEPKPEPKPEPKKESKQETKGFSEDTRCHDAKPEDITWIEIVDGSANNDWHPQATWSAVGGDTIEVRFSDDPDNLKWRFEMLNDGHESLGFMHNTGMLGMVNYYYQFRTVNGCRSGDWSDLIKAFN